LKDIQVLILCNWYSYYLKVSGANLLFLLAFVTDAIFFVVFRDFCLFVCLSCCGNYLRSEIMVVASSRKNLPLFDALEQYESRPTVFLFDFLFFGLLGFELRVFHT
jgi:hypothetical protein